MRRGSLKRGHARLGKPGDSEDGLSSLPRRDVARLGEPLHLGKEGYI